MQSKYDAENTSVTLTMNIGEFNLISDLMVQRQRELEVEFREASRWEDMDDVRSRMFEWTAWTDRCTAAHVWLRELRRNDKDHYDYLFPAGEGEGNDPLVERTSWEFWNLGGKR